MPESFTQYWTNETWKVEADRFEGRPLDHTASNEFVQRGVRPGARLYVVTNIRGRLLVAGRIGVGRIVGQREAQRAIGYKVWDASDHILPSSSTTFRFGRRVPVDVARRLRFGTLAAPLVVDANGRIDKQTLRGVRRITPESAALLDGVVGEDHDTREQADAGAWFIPEEVSEPERFPEGATRRIAVNVYERNPVARRKCIEHYGTRCQACDVDLGERYGDVGAGYIHVHHLKQLSEIGTEYEVNPVDDLRPICPTCHALIHRTTPAMKIEELRLHVRSR